MQSYVVVKHFFIEGHPSWWEVHHSFSLIRHAKIDGGGNLITTAEDG